MNREAVEKAVKLGKKTGHVFVATADADGLPHLAASGRLTAEPEGSLGISEWFCPGTLENLQINPRLSIVAWDSENDTGYQILGRCKKIEDLSMMNGFSLEPEKEHLIPQVERKIVAHISKIIRFSHAPHSDVED